MHSIEAVAKVSITVNNTFGVIPIDITNIGLWTSSAKGLKSEICHSTIIKLVVLVYNVP